MQNDETTCKHEYNIGVTVNFEEKDADSESWISNNDMDSSSPTPCSISTNADPAHTVLLSFILIVSVLALLLSVRRWLKNVYNKVMHGPKRDGANAENNHNQMSPSNINDCNRNDRRTQEIASTMSQHLTGCPGSCRGDSVTSERQGIDYF